MARNDQYYKSVRNQLEEAVSQGRDAESLFWEVMDAVATVIDAATGAKICSGTTGGASVVYGTITHQKARSVGLTPNPFFVWNGQDGNTRYTKRYLRNTSLKAIGSSAFGLFGNIASQATQVDVSGAVMHGSATGSTLSHLIQLRAIAGSHKKSITIAAWLELVMKMKTIKLGVRSTQLVGAIIPIGVVGAIAGVGAAAARIGVKLTMTNVCLAVAAEIHWRAFLEQKISGFIGDGGGKVGPASRVVHELFNHHGITSEFISNYDADKLIKEPSGWMAVSHKLLQI